MASYAIGGVGDKAGVCEYCWYWGCAGVDIMLGEKRVVPESGNTKNSKIIQKNCF